MHYSIFKPSKAMRQPTIKRYKSYNLDTFKSLRMVINISSQEKHEVLREKEKEKEKEKEEIIE